MATIIPIDDIFESRNTTFSFTLKTSQCDTKADWIVPMLVGCETSLWERAIVRLIHLVAKEQGLLAGLDDGCCLVELCAIHAGSVGSGRPQHRRDQPQPPMGQSTQQGFGGKQHVLQIFAGSNPISGQSYFSERRRTRALDRKRGKETKTERAMWEI